MISFLYLLRKKMSRAMKKNIHHFLAALIATVTSVFVCRRTECSPVWSVPLTALFMLAILMLSGAGGTKERK